MAHQRCSSTRERRTTTPGILPRKLTNSPGVPKLVLGVLLPPLVEDFGGFVGEGNYGRFILAHLKPLQAPHHGGEH